MKKISILLSVFLLLTACLKAKKSPFDFNTPGGFLFGFAVSSQGSQTLSISGNITGLTSGSLVLQNNGQNDLTITAPTDKYSFSGLSSGSTYLISVKSHPTGIACTLTKSKGTISGSISDADINCTAAKANALYTLGDATKSYWLDYVKSDGTSPLDATGTACTGSESGYYNACIHAGEFKKISIPNITSCDGITATDSLSAFNWKCVVASDGSVSVISTGLRGDKGLSDLIDFTSPGSFRNNTVTILLNGNTLLTSATGKWWDNSIVVNNSGGSLSVTKTIYIVNDTTLAGTAYTLGVSPKVALISQPGILKPVTTSGIGFGGANSFIWIEGNYSSTAAVMSTSGANKFCVFRNIKMYTTGANDIIVNGPVASIYHNVSGKSSGVFLFVQLNSSKNIFNNITTSNNNSAAVIFQTSDLIILNTVSINSGNIGIKTDAVGSFNSNIYMNTTVANNTGIALSLGTNLNTTFMNTMAVNSNNHVIQSSGSTSSKFINSSIGFPTGANVCYIQPATPLTTSSIFNGLLKFNTTNCCTINGASANPGLTDVTCARQNGSELTPPTDTTGNTTNSFVGKVNSDSKTTQSGTVNSNSVSVSDWLNFENQFRGWGVTGGFPGSTSIGFCSGGVSACAIWDWSLKATDTVVRNVNACPNGTIFDTHQWSDTTAPNQAYCDANYKGSKINGSTCITTFLRNAVEIFGDGVGNENGICESSEECLYTPNIGAYQGHSSDSINPYKLVKADITSSTNTNNCSDITTGGTITNVKLWKFDTNGY